jgi:C-terminal processing protease CtpA/Prc
MLNRTDLVTIAKALGGLPVFGCLSGSPADRAGIRYGDVLLSVDGHSTPSWDEYIEIRKRSGATILVRLFREGSEFEVELVLQQDVAVTPASIADAIGLEKVPIRDLD